MKNNARKEKKRETCVMAVFLLFQVSFFFNPLETSPEYTRAGIYGKRVLWQNQIVFNGLISFLITIEYCIMPSKLVVYTPMGAERAADRTIALSCSYVPFHSSAWCHNNCAA